MSQFPQDQEATMKVYVNTPKRSDAGIEEICHIPEGCGGFSHSPRSAFGAIAQLLSPRRALRLGENRSQRGLEVLLRWVPILYRIWHGFCKRPEAFIAGQQVSILAGHAHFYGSIIKQ